MHASDSACPVRARSGGSWQRGGMSAMEGNPDGRRTRPEPARLTPWASRHRALFTRTQVAARAQIDPVRALLRRRGAPKYPSCGARIEFPGIHSHPAVYDHIRDSNRIAVRRLERSCVADRVGIKQRKIGKVSLTNETPRAQTKLRRRHPGHFCNGFFV
jgi:hypothetical protein